MTPAKTLGLLLTFFGSIALAARTPQTISLDVRLVHVIATVADQNGHLVPDLKATDFTVYEDGVAQKISHFSQDTDVPVSVGVLLDLSGSMRDKMSAATQAISRFIDSIHKDDDIFLMTFSNRITVVQDFTSDRKKLSRALASLAVGGSTLLYDGLQRGIEKIQTGRHDKKAILVLSDGMDAGSKDATLNGLLESVRRSEVMTYGLGTGVGSYADPAEHVPFSLPSSAGPVRGPARGNRGNAPVSRGGTNSASGVNMAILGQLSEASGGRSFLLSSTYMETGASEIDNTLIRIAGELRSQYTLGYYPSTPDTGDFHSIKVVVAPQYTVRARTGYQAKAAVPPGTR